MEAGGQQGMLSWIWFSVSMLQVFFCSIHPHVSRYDFLLPVFLFSCPFCLHLCFISSWALAYLSFFRLSLSVCLLYTKSRQVHFIYIASLGFTIIQQTMSYLSKEQLCKKKINLRKSHRDGIPPKDGQACNRCCVYSKILWEDLKLWNLCY